MNRRSLPFYLAVLVCGALLGALSSQPSGLSADLGKAALFKSHVISLTNLRNTVTNFGSFGAPFGSALPGPGASGKGFWPGRQGRIAPYSSCEWPAGSRNLYLNDAELWVGGVISDRKAVTTGRFSGQEWSPVEEIGVIAESTAFSDEDTYTRYDDLEEVLGKPIDHQPLGIQVSQRTFAWTGSDFIVHDLLVENVGPDDLDSVYVGFCWDFNIASKAFDGGALGDLVGLDEENAISYMYDADGDGGRSPGYIGGKFLNTPLAGHAWWREGQDPEDDSERYALLSGGLMADPPFPSDYRLLHSVGPFYLPAGSIIPVLHILAIGDDLTDLQEVAAGAEETVGLYTAAQGDSTLGQGDIHEIPVDLQESKALAPWARMAVDWEFCEVGFTLRDPDGQVIDPDAAEANPFINYMAGPHRKSYDVIDPMPGEWTLVVEFIEAQDDSIKYQHSVTLFDVPHDFGLPMEYFQVDNAYIYFDNPKDSSVCHEDSFAVVGYFELRPESAFDPSVAGVIFRMGAYEEIIPPGSFHEVQTGVYEYCDDPPGIIYMKFADFCECWQFEVYASEMSMAGTINPVLVRLAIGPDTGFQNIFMTIVDNEWFYSAQGKAQVKSVHAEGALPASFSLSQNYPNPFNATTQIAYSIPQETEVLLALYNVRGQQVTTLVQGLQPAGSYRVTWDGRDASKNQVASGIYFCHLRVGDLSATRKMILLR